MTVRRDFSPSILGSALPSITDGGPSAVALDEPDPHGWNIMDKTPPIAIRFAALSAVSVLALTLAGCTAEARPNAEDLKSGLTAIASTLDLETALPEKYMECVADFLFESDLSDATLVKFAKAKDLTADEVAELNRDPATEAALTEAATSCASTLQ
jgi:hypothetical protein